MQGKQILKICDWCSKVLDADAPSVQTSSVDVHSALGRTEAVATKVRSYHLAEPACYREMLAGQPVGGLSVAPAKAEAMSDDEVSRDAFVWSEAFDMTAEEALSGTRRTIKIGLSPLQRRQRRLMRTGG